MRESGQDELQMCDWTCGLTGPCIVIRVDQGVTAPSAPQIDGLWWPVAVRVNAPDLDATSRFPG